jgi:hypothetical protein
MAEASQALMVMPRAYSSEASPPKPLAQRQRKSLQTMFAMICAALIADSLRPHFPSVYHT